MTSRKKKRRRKASPISVRLPLPRKGEARHGDVTKFQRSREKTRLRRQMRGAEETE